ncbi:ribosome recycling factor [Patescibacteria group bacterium]
MEYKEIINKIKPELDKTVRFFEGELAKIRTSRVSPSLIENIEVDCFGQKFPLKQLGAISCPESRQILIQPWDKSYIESIEKALSQSHISASPIVDKEAIRLSFPPLTKEYRNDLIRVISEKTEDTKKTVRRWRQEVWSEIQEKTRTGEVREDDKFRAKDELQDLIDEYNEKIETMGERKRKEIES